MVIFAENPRRKITRSGWEHQNSSVSRMRKMQKLMVQASAQVAELLTMKVKSNETDPAKSWKFLTEL